MAWVFSLTADAAQSSVAWDPVPAPVTGYYIHYGVAPRTYTTKLDAGNLPSFTLTNLAEGQTYFVAVTAYDADRLESGFSNEVSITIAAATQTTLASSSNPAALGASVTFTGSVTGVAPTGSVNFIDGGTSISGCSARSLSGSGNTRTATCTVASLASGTHSIVASYGGNASNGASASAPLAQAVEASPLVFADVPTNHWAYAAIRAIAYHAITVGCATNPARYCPTGDVERDEMAVFIERARRGVGYAFAPTGLLFADVPITHWAAGPIEQLHQDAITKGCMVGPLRFCPQGKVTRAEVAILLLRAQFGPGYLPPSATGEVFADIPAAHWAASWIEAFAAAGHTTGCRSNPLSFCPDAHVSRAEIAIFLQRVFNLTGAPS